MTPVTDFWRSLVRYPTRLGWVVVTLLALLVAMVTLHAVGRIAAPRLEPTPYSKLSTRSAR